MKEIKVEDCTWVFPNRTKGVNKDYDVVFPKLKEVIKHCITALYESMSIAPLEKIPTKTGEAIQEAQAVLDEIKDFNYKRDFINQAKFILRTDATIFEGVGRKDLAKGLRRGAMILNDIAQTPVLTFEQCYLEMFQDFSCPEHGGNSPFCLKTEFDKLKDENAELKQIIERMEKDKL